MHKKYTYVDTDRKTCKVFQLRKKNSTNQSDFCLPLPSSFRNSSFCLKTGTDINFIALKRITWSFYGLFQSVL